MPPASFDYTLVALMIPWGWLALVCVKDYAAGADVARYSKVMVTLAIAMAPLSFLHNHVGRFFYAQGMVRTVALLLLLRYACHVPFPDASWTPSTPGRIDNRA